MITFKAGELSLESIDFVNTLTMYKNHKLKLLNDLMYLSRQPYFYKIEKLVMFGSCYKGNATMHSDIDIGVYLNTDLTLFERADLRQTLNDSGEFGIETNVVFVCDLNPSSRIFKEIENGIVIYELPQQNIS